MKLFALLTLFVILFTGCSPEDDTSDIVQELAPVTSVELPESFIFGQSYSFDIHYKLPTACHRYTGIDVSQNSNELSIGVVTNYQTGINECSTTGNLERTVSLNFVAERDDFYIFKFWQGENGAGDDIFLRIEVPVNQPGIE